MTDRFDLAGSGWTARATVVEEFGAGDGPALRLLRVVEAEQPAADRAALVVARLDIASAAVDLVGTTASWSAGEVPLTVDLVLAVDGSGSGSGSGSVPVATPLAGDIPLAWLDADDQADVEALHQLIGVIPSPHAEPVLSPDGIVVRGTRPMPWDPQELSAPYTAHPLSGGGIRVTPELARLDATERAQWGAAWRRFSAMIEADDGPEWMRLTVPNPREVPAVAFIVEQDGGRRREQMVLPTGSLVVELTDGVPGHADRPIRSALRLHGTIVTIAADTIAVSYTPDDETDPTGTGPKITVTVSEAGGSGPDATPTWTERVVVDGRFEPDPVALAERLRGSTVRDGAPPGVVTASTVLADGWLQLPVPDVVEQDYVDRAIPTPARVASGRAEGAVVWGNEAPDLRTAALAARRSRSGNQTAEPAADPTADEVAADELVGRTRWSLALLDAAGFRGTWKLGELGGTRRVLNGNLELFGVSATADGLWWLATGPGSAPGGSPPDPASWSQAVAPVPVHVGGAVAGRRPSAIAVDVHAEFGPRPLVGDRRLVGELTDAAVTFAVDADLGTALNVIGPQARAWLRHPTLPTVQTLPLDTTVPRRRPSASRQLMPSVLAPGGGAWTLTGGERSWPTLGPSPLVPAPEWVGRSGLTQAVLSMPGVELVPSNDGLQLAVRHDLPPLDEAAAFATVDADIVEGPTSEPWWRLEERGVLAALDQARLLAFDHPLVDDAAAGTLPVADGRRGATTDRPVTTDLSVYPGAMTVGGQTLFDADPEAGDRLVGRSDDTIPMHSGAIVMTVEGPVGDRRTRDQDDVGRGDATISSGWVRVPVYDGDEESYVAASSLAPIELAGAGRTWLLAVDGLPMRPRPSAGGGLHFDHEDRDGLLAHDAHRTHRWRLGPGPLALGGLDVHPVRLAGMEVDGNGDLLLAEIDVRLQLPEAGGSRSERPRLPGLVRLRFEPALGEVRLLEESGVWPVAGSDGAQLVELRWGSISHHEGVVTVDDLVAHFHLFDRPWALPLDQPLRFVLFDADSAVVGTSTSDGGTASLRWTAFRVTLDLSGEYGGHSSVLDLELVAGGMGGVDADAGDLVATVTIDVGAEQLSADATVRAAATCFGGRLTATDVMAAIGSRSLQFSWPNAEADEGAADLEVLPGMILSSATRPGVLSARFEPSPVIAGLAPDLSVTAIHAEQVLGCSWNADPRWDDGFSVDGEGGWYRGDLSVGYVGTLTDAGWKASFLLDGVLEIAGLVSHAAHDDVDAPGLVTPFMPTERGTLVRHTARILFQQHRLTNLRVQKMGHTLVGLAGPIELDAVVEHSLRRLIPGEDGYVVDGDDRFTVPQQVLLLRPTDLAQRLARQRASARPIGGFAAPAFTDLVDAAVSGLPADTLVIEASVSALARRADRPAASPSRLRTVPSGVVEVVRVGLDDHLDPSPPTSVFEAGRTTDGLIQLDLPFLAVALAKGATNPAGGSAASALAIDPVDVLASGASGDAAALAGLITSRVEPAEGESAPAAVGVGAFDGNARTFAHAAERRISTAWQLLTDPTRQGPSGDDESQGSERGVTDGVLASEPDVLGRMGSPATLRRVLGWSVVAAASPRPATYVSFDHSGRTSAAPVIAFDFTEDDAPRGTHYGALERSGQGWHLDAAGLRLADLRGNAENKSMAVVTGAASPLVEAVKAAGAFSVHLRVQPAKSPQQGPARILSLSWSIIKRLFTIGQDGDQIVVRVRNGSRDTNGVVEEVRSHWAEGPLQAGRWVDIAYVFDGLEERLFINGKAVGIKLGKRWYTRPRQRQVDFDSWDPDGMELLLGNERTGKRPWVGRWARLAVFAGAVTPADLAGSSPVVGSGPGLPFLATGPSVRRAFGGPSPRLRHHVATNILPVDLAGGGDLIPSPYLTFGIDSDDRDRLSSGVVATSAELLLDGSGVTLVSSGGRFWEGDPGDEEIERWAESERARVGGDSTRTVVRLRRVVASGTSGAVSAEVDFIVLAQAPTPQRLGWRSPQLRSGSSGHRRPDRHVLDAPPWTTAIPATAVAPPLVSALDVVRDAAAGISAVSVDSVLAPTGVVSEDGTGNPDPLWLGVSRRVRFAADVGSLGQPDDFDAPVRAVLAPTAAAPPLPPAAAVVIEGEQAVALDRVRHLLTGIRPGAMIEVRSHRQRHDGLRTFAAGTLPYVIRAPRPLVSDPATDPRTATRPTAGFADRAATVWAEPNRFELVQIRDEACLRIEVTDPVLGTIARGHEGVVSLLVGPVGGSVSTLGADDTWSVSAGFVGGEGGSALFLGGEDADPPSDTTLSLAVTDDVRTLLRSTPVGEWVTIRVNVVHTRGGRQQARRVDVPLRVVADEELPLLVEPRFCRFEDPEYNRAISTAVARLEVTGVAVSAGGPSAIPGCTFVVSKDRSAHAPGAPMLVGVQVRAPEGDPFSDPAVAQQTVGNGLQVELHVPDRPPIPVVVLPAVADPGRVGWVGAVELPDDLDPDRPPDVVVQAPGAATSGHLRVPIVEDQSPPAPTAAYALLREDTEGAVSCPRYALGPTADRITLVDTHDVLSTIMRYRAEFGWTDLVRAGTDTRYEVQKISRLGATHVPSFR